MTKKARAAFQALALTSVIAAVPLMASAGFFSFTAELFTREVAQANEPPSSGNSQTTPLLQAALHPDPNPSKGGGDITVIAGALLAESGPYGTLADINDLPHSDQISIYVVREGDSLSQIADMFGVSVNTIAWANNLSRGSLIKPGQTLVILPVTGVRHTVVKNDTLKSIAKKYKGDLEEILQYNGLAEDSALTLGEVIVIPNGEIAAPPSSVGTVMRGGSGPSYAGYYLRPINGGHRSQGLHGYNGIDLAAPYGTPIMASANGTVIVSKSGGWNGGYGSYIVISHPNGTQTLYAHASNVVVYAGQTVVQGQVIGYMGATGRATGPHVHFEIRGAKNPF